MIKREGLSADCTLNPMLTIGIMMTGKEHPCDRCNMDRKKCRGYQRIDEEEEGDRKRQRTL